MKKIIFILIANFVVVNSIGQTLNKNDIEKKVENIHTETKIVQDFTSKLITELDNQIKSSNDAINISKLNLKLNDLRNIYNGSLKTKFENDLEFAKRSPNSIEALKLISNKIIK